MVKKKRNEELIIEAKSLFEAYKTEIGKNTKEDKKVVYNKLED